MKNDFEILKEVFTVKNMLLAVLFNILAYSSMYLFLEIILFIKYF